MTISEFNTVRDLVYKRMYGKPTVSEKLDLALALEKYTEEEFNSVFESITFTEEFRDRAFRDDLHSGFYWKSLPAQILDEYNAAMATKANVKTFFFRKIRVEYIALLGLSLIVIAFCGLLVQTNKTGILPGNRDCGPGLFFPQNDGPGNSKKYIQGGKHNLEVPNSHQYNGRLPDSSLMVLNASSAVRYPLNFNADNRQIDLEGEAFFDIDANMRHPFRINIRHVQLEILGTRLYVKSYRGDDSIYVTVETGSIKIINGPHSSIVQGGQQAAVAMDTDTMREFIKISPADLPAARAWKEGYFSFRKTGIREVILTFSRWYNWEVQFPRPRKNEKKFTGYICRKTPENEILEVLRNSGIHLEKKGNQVVIKE